MSFPQNLYRLNTIVKKSSILFPRKLRYKILIPQNMQTELILTDYGKTLRAQNRRFIVEEDGKELVNLPMRKVKTIRLFSGNKLTTNALFLALQGEIPVFLMYRNGQVAASLRSPAYGSIATIRVQQAFFSRSPEGMIWAKNLVLQKIENQKRILRKELRNRKKDSLKKFLQEKLSVLEKAGKNLMQKTFPQRRFLMAQEAFASRAYFSALSRLLPAEYAFSK